MRDKATEAIWIYI